MINELYMLSDEIDKAGAKVQIWHRKYKPIPNIRKTAPCIRIVISNGDVTELSYIGKELGSELRKFGSNQGTFPCMNLAPLYRITDDAVKKELSNICPEDLSLDKIKEIKTWCKEDNWEGAFKNKYKISMENTTAEMLDMVSDFEPLKILIEESRIFQAPNTLHKKLEDVAFGMLKRRENISLAFMVLFYQSNSEKEAAKDYGTLSIAFDTPRLIDRGIPAVSKKFVLKLNESLLSAELLKDNDKNSSVVDAFGIPFKQIEEPMPEVKLAGGFDVKLRTMFKEHKCQRRYGRIETASYPISPIMRGKLHAVLNWLGNAEHKNKTWIKINRDEIFFAYPAHLPDSTISYVNSFKPVNEVHIAFPEQAKQFIECLNKAKKPGTDSNADRIQLFIIRRIDKGRRRVVYTRQTDPHELEACSEAWNIGCTNLPDFSFGYHHIPFPLNAADILNSFWKQNGDPLTNEYKPVPVYHGMELLMEPDLPVTYDLHNLSQKAMTIGAFLGNKLACRELHLSIWKKIKDMLALMGLVLYREGIRKDVYMENLPYLYGQLLKVSDELHALYCNVVRDGNLPTQLAGSGLYQAAAETPGRTLHLLGLRMNPYITWAKTYRTKEVYEKRKESWRAGWLISLYEDIATRLFKVWNQETRFNDEEKAQLFIGYLAAFPKKEHGDKCGEYADQSEEVHNYE